MKKFKVLLCAALVLAVPSVYASKDFQAIIPTGNYAMGAFEGMEAYQMIKDKNVGRNVVCNLWLINTEPVKVQIAAANYLFENNDSPDGVYTVTSSTPVNFRKFNAHPIVSGYPSSIRLFNLSQVLGNVVIANCFYF